MKSDTRWIDAVAQAELVRTGAATPLELVDAAIERIERDDPQINAVVTRWFDEARTMAASALPDVPFAGVPFLMKDNGDMQKGRPYYQGNRALREAKHIADHDSPLGRHMRNAGFLSLGNSSAPEFGMQGTTQPLSVGPCHNPWDLERSTAGSSGGAAAAVASGMVPVAGAGDGLGSIRLPASWCGLVGLKSSRGRISEGGAATIRIRSGGVVSRTVRDTAAILDQLHGPDPGDLFIAPSPSRPYVDELEADRKGLRVGMVLESAFGVVPMAEVASAIHATAQTLEDLGHHVEAVYPKTLISPELWERFEASLGGGGVTKFLAQMLGRPLREGDLEPVTLAVSEREQKMAPHVVDAMIQAWVARVCTEWAELELDLLVQPVQNETALTLLELEPSGDDLAQWYVDHLHRVAVHTAPYNFTGQPAISLPMAWTQAGLPVGVQIAAAMGREDLLIDVAAQLERARPWIDRRPPAVA